MIDISNDGFSWGSSMDAQQKSAKESLGYDHRNHQDWFAVNDPQIPSCLIKCTKLIKCGCLIKNQSQSAMLLSCPKNHARTKLREMNQNWWIANARALQRAADKIDIKNLLTKH